MTGIPTADDLALLREAAREAGAMALRYLPQEPGSLDEGRHFAGQRGRLRGRPLPAARAAGRAARTMAGSRRKPTTAPAGSPPAHLRRRSDRRHARLHGRRSTLVRQRSPSSRTASRSPACSNARRRERDLLALRRRRRLQERPAAQGARAARSAPLDRRPEDDDRRCMPAHCQASCSARLHSLARLPASRWWPTAGSTRHSSSPTRMTGISPPPT